MDIYQHLWCNTYTNSTNINKTNIYNFLTGNKKINLTIGDSKKFFNNNYDIVDLSTIGDDDYIISYSEWLKNPIINQYLSITLLPIDKTTIDNKRNIPYQMNPYLLSADKLIDYRWIDKQGNRIIQTKS